MENSRPIRFRAWDNTEEEIGGQRMVDWEELSQWDEDGAVCFLDILSGSIDVIPMQYTGLHDKNGTEIYEGDFVYINDSYSTKPYEVRWGPDRWEAHAEDEGYGNPNTIDSLNMYVMEIIGNRFENPELLEPTGD